MAFLILANAQPVNAQQLIKEDFSADGTRLPRGWTTENAIAAEHWNLRDGVLVSGNNATLPNKAPSFAVIDAEQIGNESDVKVSVEFWMTADSGEVYLLARRRDPNTYYAAVLSAPVQGRNSVRIERINRGESQVLETRDTGIPQFEGNSLSQQPFRFSFEVAGADMEVRLNGIVLIAATDELPIISGTVGLGHQNNDVLFDRFVVEKVEAKREDIIIPETTSIVASDTLPPTNLPAGDLVGTGGAFGGVPGTFGGAGAGAVPSASTDFRVSIVTFPTQQQADEIGERIKADLGYWNTQVGPDGPNWMVYMEAESLDAANTLADDLQQQGYFTATVIGPSPGGPSSGGSNLPTTGQSRLVFDTPTFQTLTQAERQTIATLTSEAESPDQIKRLSQTATVDPALQRKLEQMAEELEAQLNDLTNQNQMNAQVQQQMGELRDKANSYLRQENIPAATRILTEMREIDKDHTWVQLVEDGINRRTTTIKEKQAEARRFNELLQAAREASNRNDPDGALAAWLRVTASNNTDLLTPAIETEADKALRDIRAQTTVDGEIVRQEISAVQDWLKIMGVVVGIIAIAVIIYIITTKRRVKRIMEEALPDMVLPELMEGLGPLGLEIKEAPLALPGQTEANNETSGKDTGKKDPPPAPPKPGSGMSAPAFSASPSDLKPTPSELSASEKAPEPAPAGDPFAAPVVPSAPVPEQKPAPEPKPAPKKKEEVPLFKPAPDTGGGLDLGGISDINMGPSKSSESRAAAEPPKADDIATEARSSKVAAAQDAMLDGILGDIPGGNKAASPESPSAPEPPAAPESKAASAAEEETWMELPTQEADDKTGDDAGDATGDAAEEEDDENKPDFGDFGLGDSFEFTPPPTKEDSSAMTSSSSSTSTSGIVAEVIPAGESVELSYDQTAMGEKPLEWEGDFDFASLTVVDPATLGASPGGANAPARALAYQKATGAGQIYYSITFPDAKGEVDIEFDLCCVDKNRYLLGVYLEKDRDFRHSIQTVIHRANPQAAATLRIQGKPIAYEMKSWAHIKFSLKMDAHQIDAEVNGEKVIMAELMENMPDRINTLAIRDNHPTTGKLMIANVKITRIA